MRQRVGQNLQPSAGDPARSVFWLEGEYWTIAHGVPLFRLRDSAGLRQVADLLRHPGERIAAERLARLGHRARGVPAGNRREAEAERARVRVTRSIRSALRRIGAHSAALIAYLNATIKTGRYCSYAPDPRLPVEWDFGSDPQPDDASGTSPHTPRLERERRVT
jgi:hypothetical protein